MSKPKILLQLDTDEQPSVFDSVVALDAGADHLLRQHSITADNVRDQVHGAIFTRGPGDLHHTAIFIGGSNVAAAEAVLAEVRRTFFGPMRVSVMLDPSGANTTAAAAVAAAGKHLALRDTTAVVLAATGPVGQRAVRLLALEGAALRVVSRRLERARAVCDAVTARYPAAKIVAARASSEEETIASLSDAALVIATGAAGVELASSEALRRAGSLKVAIDLNAVPPAGLGGVEVMDRGAERAGVICYGAVGVGGVKMKIHKRAIQRLFETNDQVLDAEELYAIAVGMRDEG
ncbi:MAG: bifunctional NADP-dependent methylenetetrahydromethanopterin dehydrogenase/methylenetetrahydrofolate dehydrogenase [Planctomycetia bacterium 21-64-5]|nr:MAG: bifunctional NADP-dependent methylenetetrahydromethanopterin dehydrogenase/methylenetetrahydrofolate dehydrogenase [Planctomycetia bacterium 21-64-5]HQU42870.1 methylene-tetrahydromethanopterin dehydrogenase N-terminal domain-containing protein [Pirellulales bacterium]